MRAARRAVQCDPRIPRALLCRRPSYDVAMNPNAPRLSQWSLSNFPGAHEEVDNFPYNLV